VFPTLYPNLWVVLVAPQGEGHKSSALRIGYKLLTSLPDYVRPRIFAAKLTPEKLVANLAVKQLDESTLKRPLPPGLPPTYFKEPAIGVLYSSELGVLLGREKYNIGFISLLTELYDCHDEWSSETIMRGDQKLYNVCLTLLGASTPDWMQSMLPQDAFQGGFMSRLLLVTKPVEWNIRIPDPPPAPQGLRGKILEELIDIGQVAGRMQWTQEAKDFFEEWYTSLGEREVVPGPVAAARERMQDHLLRLAILLQLAETKKKLVLEKHSIELALKILNTIGEETDPILEYIATEPRMRSAQFILETLRKHKRLTEAELLKLVWRQLSSPREFDDMLGMLIKAKKVTTKESTKGGFCYEYCE